MFWEFFARKRDWFLKFSKVLVHLYFDHSVASLVEVDRVIFSPVLHTDRPIVKTLFELKEPHEFTKFSNLIFVYVYQSFLIL